MSYDNPCDAIVCNVPGETCENGICKCGSARSCEGSLSGSFCDLANSKCKCSAKEDACKDGLLCDPMDGKCKRCVGQSSCCTKDSPCGVGGGDCNEDTDCMDGLKCGKTIVLLK